MGVPVSLRLAAPIAVMASIALLPIKAHANAFVFANPAGFPAQGSTPQVYDFLGTGDLSVTAPFKGGGITFRTSSVDFGEPGTNNPAWTGDTVQPMFRISFDGIEGGQRELAQLDFTFANLLSSQSYMVFSDFDSFEGLAIAAYDQSNILIPFESLTLSRFDGEDPDGASYTTPSWTNTNPTNGWATVDTGWVGASSISGFLQDTTNFNDSDNAAVALQANQSISRVSFYYNAESISGPSNGATLRFNFAGPSAGPGPSDQVPGPLPVLGIFAAFAFSRKLRQRINRA